jgi:hypothetical protein
MAQRAGHCDTRRAQRLTTTILVVRFVLTALIALLVTLLIIFSVAVDREFSPVNVLQIFGGAIIALTVYVTFGWLEQTLVLLIGIAFNTAEASNPRGSEAANGAPVETPGPTPKPGHWSDRQERAYQHLVSDSASPDEPI